MNVLVNGIGNIGTTLLNCLAEFRDILELDNIYANKNFPNDWTNNDLIFLKKKGINILNLDFTSDRIIDDTILKQIDFIFDCTTNGQALKNKEKYKNLPNLIGCNAQGSEKNFGIPYFYNINPHKISSNKFCHIVSCNTHGTGYLINLFPAEVISSVDVVTVRRSEDIGNHKRLVSANVVARHLDSVIGTHHGIDVKDTYKTIDREINITTSDITTPSQLLHSIRFNISTKSKITNLKEIIRKDSLLGYTNKFDSNFIFELGRRYGFQGRIYNPLIIVENNLILNENNIVGWAFVPQEGNTIISTIAAFLYQTNSTGINTKMELIKSKLIIKKW